MTNTNGQAYAFMATTPILPGRTAALQDYLDGLPGGEDSPLARMGTTHFARWIVLRDLVHQGPPQRRDTLQSSYLVFVSNFDGSLDRYLTELLARMGAEADAIWGNCVGYPGTDDVSAFIAYLKHNQIETTAFLPAYPHATVAKVREALELRRQMAEFAVGAQGKDPAALRQAFFTRFPAPAHVRAPSGPSPTTPESA
ncbi:hypothetical protein HUT18_07055 [Streptomyces sp. NA04227]|uniref:hypothetical protein n=1 Tax=Streptomyces sp. NA04227 TaxID=2742136 RepID=UPI0015906FF9|nr:hypothetical protein [Streptomyces sp. NA04227]QKW06197.1 hypothetical protein HUT18_07055 [Streptomyces sp. NA04227]